MLLLKSVMMREWEPNHVGAEVCPEAKYAEEHEEQWTVSMIKSGTCACAGPWRVTWSRLGVACNEQGLPVHCVGVGNPPTVGAAGMTLPPCST